MAALKVETDIITSISESLIRQDVILMIMSDKTFKTEVIVFICDAIMCLMSDWLMEYMNIDTTSQIIQLIKITSRYYDSCQLHLKQCTRARLLLIVSHLYSPGIFSVLYFVPWSGTVSLTQYEQGTIWVNQLLQFKLHPICIHFTRARCVRKKKYIYYIVFLGGRFSDAHITCETMYKCCLTLTKLIDQ
jgi:hypothetical protein